MAVSSNLCCILLILIVSPALGAPAVSSKGNDQLCSSAQLVAPGQGSLIYKYKTQVKLSVANSNFDLKNEYSADVHIKNLGECKYALQLHNVKITETKDESTSPVTSTAKAQKSLENTVVYFRWVDGFVWALEADASAQVDNVNFIKGIISALQVYSPVPTDGENIVREEDVLGVCTTRYRYTQKNDATYINKRKDFSTCSRDKLHLGSSPVLTSLLGPIIEENFVSKTSYVCQTEIRDKTVQSVHCKTIEVDEDKEKSSKKAKDQNQNDSSSEEEEDEENDDEEISSKLIFIKQELKLQSGGNANVDTRAIQKPEEQTLQFVPTAAFDRSNEAVSSLVSKIQSLINSEAWNEFAASQFVQVTNELRRMDRANVNAFKTNPELRDLAPSILQTIYASDPAASQLNFDPKTMKFSNPLSVYYLDDPSAEFVEQLVQASRQLKIDQVRDFVGLTATILKTYKNRQTHNKDADAKIKEFQKSISKFLENISKDKVPEIVAVLAAYAQLGLYEERVRRLAASDQAPLEIQYHALNAIRQLSDEYLDKDSILKIRTDIQTALLRKLQNKANKNAARIWAFDALYTPFIFNPEEAEPTLSDNFEKAVEDIVNEPLNQVNGYIWSVLKFSSLDRRCPLRGLAARIRVRSANKKQYSEQATLSSRRVQLSIPLRKNYRAAVEFSVVFENDRAVPSFLALELAFDGVRRETLRLPWFEVAMINQNLDWNVADYFLRLDPLNQGGDLNSEQKDSLKNNLPPGIRKMQKAYDEKDEDPDPNVHLVVKLFGADLRVNDATDRVQDILRTNIRTFLRNALLNRMKDLAGQKPIYRLPLEIGAASAAANGLTLYRSAQLGILADLTNEFKNTRDADGIGTFTLNSKSAISFSLTLTREVSSPMSAIGETIRFGILSNIPFEYSTVANKDGRTRELNFPKSPATAFSMDFQYATRTSAGLESVPVSKSAANDPSCTPSVIYRTLGVKLCLELNPFRSIQIGTRATYPIKITLSKDPSIQKWRIGWRFNANDAPQYEVAVQKVGTTDTYPGLGVSVTKTGNDFDIKVLTGMKTFNVKGSQSGNNFNGKIFSSEGKEVMTTSGTLSVNSAGFNLNTKVFDSNTKKEVITFTTDILPNTGNGLTLNVAAATGDKAKSFKIHFRGNLYQQNQQLFHLAGGFDLGSTSYEGKVHLERSEAQTIIELRRSLRLGPGVSPVGYDFVYQRKTAKTADDKSSNIDAQLSLRTPARTEPTKVLQLNADFRGANDGSEVSLQSSLDFLIMTREPPVQERVEVEYVRSSVRTPNQAKRLISPQGKLKLRLGTKSGLFNLLINHRHRRSSEPSKKGNDVLSPTLEIENKIHIAADSDKLLPDIPRPFAFEVLSDLDFDLLNKIDYKAEYNLPNNQRSASFSYQSQVDRVVDGHLFHGTSKSDIQWDNKQKKATAVGTFRVCTNSRTLTTHWDIDTNLVQDKNDAEFDLQVRFDRKPKLNAPKSFIGAYNVSVKAPKHELFQSLNLLGNLTRQSGFLETYNSIAFRKEKMTRQININAVIERNRTGDGSLQTKIGLSLPLKNLPYITHELKLERVSPAGPVSQLSSQFLAEPVVSHFAKVDVDRSDAARPPKVHVENEFEYLRANGDNLYALSRIDVHRWTTLHSFGLLKRNYDVLHKHSIGYIFSTKTRRVAISLESPQLSGTPLSLIGELTIDRENRIGKMKLPKEFAIQAEFSTPISSLTGIHFYYNLPMFEKDDAKTVDANIGFKVASPKIAPISFYVYSRGSLNSTLHISEALSVGKDIAFNGLLTAQFNPQLASQISLSTSAKFYDSEVHNSIYALFKQHQLVVRGMLNATDFDDYKYEMDIGYDQEALVGHTERTDGQKITVSDIDAKKCSASGKYIRCYRGDITIRTAENAPASKGTFDLNWGSGTAKLDVRVPNQIELKFDHTHTGRVRDEDFKSETSIDARSLRNDNKGSFNYAGSVEKEDGKWNTIELRGSIKSPRTGEKVAGGDIRVNQKVTNRRLGAAQRTVGVVLESRGRTLLDWSSEANPCSNRPTDVLQGICQTATFKFKLNNDFAQRLRQRLELPADPRLSNPAGQVDYDGTLNIDLKLDPKSGPHTAKLDLNRMSDDAVDLDVAYQPRTDDTQMSLNLKANLPRQTPISLNYAETRRTSTNFDAVIKYSFNAKDASAEKTYKCQVDRKSLDDISLNCVGERTTLVLDIDRAAGKSKIYVDLNRFKGERIGYEVDRNPGTKELDATLYTLVSSWNVKRQPGKSTVVVVKQNNAEVLRVEGTRNSEKEIQIRFSPSGVNLKMEWDESSVFTVKQTAPVQRDLFTITIDRARIRPYLPSLRNQNRPSMDIDEQSAPSTKPLVAITFGPHVFVSLSQALYKLGSHNGLYGLDTIKKMFKLQIGTAQLAVYNLQHWKTHGEDSQLPESYGVRLVNSATGSIIQLATQRWSETRMITKIGHSFDAGKSMVTDLKLDRDYAVEVGSVYFFRSLGYRNTQAVKQLRNSTRLFLRTHLTENLIRADATQLANDFRRRLRSILEKDYAAASEIVEAWNKEPENSFLRRWSTRVGLKEFFDKYPTYSKASDMIFATIIGRQQERSDFWRNRTEAILNDNRLHSLTERVEKVRAELIQKLLLRAETVLDRLLPKADQASIDKRIVNYVNKLLEAFKKFSTRNKDQWKNIFKAIDDASKGPENKWFRTLVADIDSAAFGAAADAESSKMFKRLDDSSKLLINNIQQLSRRISKGRENIRERVKNAIRHIPRAYANGTHFEILFPIGRQPGSYTGTSELMLGIGSLLRNRDQAFETMRAILVNRLDAGGESLQNYWKALRSFAKRVFKRNPSLTPEFKAIITNTGDGLNVHNDYIYLNPACEYVLAHDFANLKFSFRYSNGKVYSLIPNEGEIKEYDCSPNGRVRVCRDKNLWTINIPMYYGGQVDGVFGDVRDRSGRSHLNLNKWLLRDCPAARSDQDRAAPGQFPECADENDDHVKFCENFLRHGLASGANKEELLAQVMQARREAA